MLVIRTDDTCFLVASIVTGLNPAFQALTHACKTSTGSNPDGQQIAFSTSRDGPYQVYRKNAWGSGEEERLTNVPTRTDPLDWNPDGRFIVYRQTNRGTGWDLMALPPDGSREPVVLLQTPESDSDARCSPDGRFLAYRSRMNGRKDGRGLYYRALDEKIMAAEIQLSPVVRVERPRIVPGAAE
jgi:Tol biopolymer transport system component